MLKQTHVTRVIYPFMRKLHSQESREFIPRAYKLLLRKWKPWPPSADFAVTKWWWCTSDLGKGLSCSRVYHMGLQCTTIVLHLGLTVVRCSAWDIVGHSGTCNLDSFLFPIHSFFLLQFIAFSFFNSLPPPSSIHFHPPINLLRCQDWSFNPAPTLFPQTPSQSSSGSGDKWYWWVRVLELVWSADCIWFDTAGVKSTWPYLGLGWGTNQTSLFLTIFLLLHLLNVVV